MTYLNLALNFIFSAIVLSILFLPRFMIISNLYSKFNYLFNYKRWILMIIFLIFITMNSIGFNLLKGIFKIITPVSQIGSMLMGESLFTLIWPAILCLMVMFLSFKNYKETTKII